jgi:hypothetical protein
MNDEVEQKTLREKFDQLRRMFPKRNGGQIYRAAPRTPRTQATLYTYLVSDEGTHMIHETIFNKKEAQPPAWWRDWILTKALRGTGHPSEGTSAERKGIMRGSVLPGINVRTQKFWRIERVLGWWLHDLHQPTPSPVAAGRHKTKSQRRKNGQDNLRSGHRNRKRRTKHVPVLQRRRKARKHPIRKPKQRKKKVSAVVRRKKTTRSKRRVHS